MTEPVTHSSNVKRNRLVAGFLVSLAVLLYFAHIKQNYERGIAVDRATGLSAGSGLAAPSARSKVGIDSLTMNPFVRSPHVLPASTRFGATIGGVPGTPPPPPASHNQTDRLLTRTGTLEIVVADPLRAAEQLRDLAISLSGFIVSSRVSGAMSSGRSAQVQIRVPAGSFDEARRRVRAAAKSVEQETVEAQDVTRQHIDQQASLRNARAEEGQYLQILKHAVRVEDVLEVTSKLSDVRERIDRVEAESKALDQQVEMSLLTVDITGLSQAQVFGRDWRPLNQVKSALRDALAGLTDYLDSMMALLLNVPLIVLWSFTVILVIKVGWTALRAALVLFFPQTRRLLGATRA